ncbi:glycosyltransferase family 4 protein [Clostridium oryzae]|uniref:Capsular glucan synthase n=1 Tax=Clostridium oryzae TaxID=1450648 RepID=A0A1V4IRP3_9CLOT|nr:glycosyltransferase family 4 protein [Clostridium oryzae]OPJ62701.1 capsular glucan synthase [Clostridium oryzae]
MNKKIIKDKVTLDNNAKRLSIAMIGHKRVPSREGGVEIVVEQLSIRMAALGHKVTVYNRKGHHVGGKEYDTPSNSETMKRYKELTVVSVPTIEGRGLAALTSSFFGTVMALFKHYDCIHYHAEGPAAMVIIPHIFGIRTVVTIHGLDWKRAKWGGFATKYLKFGEKIAVKYASQIIVLSRNVERYFREQYHRETVFIPNGIERPQIKQVQLIKEKWNLDKDSYILFLGRIVPEKGILYLIDAYKQLNTAKKLVIAGGSSDTNQFMSEVTRAVENDRQVILTGFVQGQELEELFSNAYIYVLPSDLEGMPISLLEAMSYGNCCVVSDIPECTEVVEDKAVVFKKSDAQDLKNKLENLINEPAIVEKYRVKASEFICNKYNWSNVVARTLALYS